MLAIKKKNQPISIEPNSLPREQDEEEMKEGMAQLLTKADVRIKMDHCAEGSQGQESFHVWLDELEFDGIELTDSGEG